MCSSFTDLGLGSATSSVTVVVSFLVEQDCIIPIQLLPLHFKVHSSGPFVQPIVKISPDVSDQVFSGRSIKGQPIALTQIKSKFNHIIQFEIFPDIFTLSHASGSWFTFKLFNCMYFNNVDT